MNLKRWLRWASLLRVSPMKLTIQLILGTSNINPLKRDIDMVIKAFSVIESVGVSGLSAQEIKGADHSLQRRN